MTIRRGEDWGEQVDRPDDLVVVDGDAELARWDADRPVAVRGGDLHRMLGAPADDRARLQRVDVDGLVVMMDGGEPQAAVAHVVMRRSWWRGRIVAVMNVSHIGSWNVAPRAHPNDGRFDVVEVSPAMGRRARWAARSRLAAGTHVPHPDIVTARHDAHEWSFARPYDVWIDGVRAGRANRIAIRLVPDRYRVHA